MEASARPRPVSARVALGVTGLGLIWVAAFSFGLVGPLGASTFVLLGTGAAAATIVGLHRNRPRVRWPWIVIASALLVFIIGGVAREGLHTLGNLSPSRSVVPDLVTIPGYLLLGIGIFGIVRARKLGRDAVVDVLLDGLVAALATLTLAWVFLINPALYDAHASLQARVLVSCYPPLSVFLVAIVAQFAFSAGTRLVPAHRFLLTSMICMLIGDAIYMLAETRVISESQRMLDLPYALAFLGCVATVLHPSMRDLTEPVPAEEQTPRTGRLALVALALGVPGIVTVSRANGTIADRIVLGVIVSLLTAAAVVRVLRALRASARSEARLAYQVVHDSLTGLPNRAFIQGLLATKLDRARDNGDLVALLFLDVDRFKLVNDTHGHGTGDELLLAVANRLNKSSRAQDVVGRVGGDEFVIVTGVASVADAMGVAERIRCAFVTPFEVRAMEIAASVSIGVAVSDATEGSDDAEGLMRDADTAMYQAKDAGRNAVAAFTESMRDEVAHRLELERDLRHALEREQLQLHYQPIIDLRDGRLLGFEALLRWSHPIWGQIPPLAFIPIAEDTGLILPIGAWVIDDACRQLACWRGALENAQDLSIAVNLSARQLRDARLVERVRTAFTENALPARLLHLELTESLLMEDPNTAKDVLGSLRDLGVQLAIDDFGTGYSSLAYLQRFPVDFVKIDRSFVDGLNQDDSSEATLVTAIVAMTHTLKISTIAEGVETETQASRLRHLGCRAAQGYLYGRPIPAGEVPMLLAQRRPPLPDLGLVRIPERA